MTTSRSKVKDLSEALPRGQSSEDENEEDQEEDGRHGYA